MKVILISFLAIEFYSILFFILYLINKSNKMVTKILRLSYYWFISLCFCILISYLILNRGDLIPEYHEIILHIKTPNWGWILENTFVVYQLVFFSSLFISNLINKLTGLKILEYKSTKNIISTLYVISLLSVLIFGNYEIFVIWNSI